MGLERQLERLQLTFVTKKEIRASSSTKKLSPEDKEKRFQLVKEHHRARWLAARAEYPHATISELKPIIGNTRDWLYRHDREWLRDNDVPRRHKPQVRQDWKRRDEQLAREVRAYAQELLNLPGRPVRITQNKVLHHLDPSRSFYDRNHHFPLTKHALGQVTETMEEYIIRKIKWVVERCKQDRIAPTRSTLRRLASFPYHANGGVETPAIRTALDTALEMLHAAYS